MIPSNHHHHKLERYIYIIFLIDLNFDKRDDYNHCFAI